MGSTHTSAPSSGHPAWVWGHAYLLDCEDQLPIAEEDDGQRDAEVDHEHVEDEGLVVDLGLECIVVNPT